MGPVTSSGKFSLVRFFYQASNGSRYIVRLEYFMARIYLNCCKRFNKNINCSTFRGPLDKTLSRKDERSKNLDKIQRQKHIQENNNGQEVPSHQHRTPSFRYHLVSTNSSRPIVGIYLPEGSN